MKVEAERWKTLSFDPLINYNYKVIDDRKDCCYNVGLSHKRMGGNAQKIGIS